MEKIVVGPPNTSYSQGIVTDARRLLFIAGQVALDAEGRVVGLGDMTAQARQVFENMRAILEEAGGDLRNVVKITTFITNMAEFPAFAQVRREYFVTPLPASTTVEVTRLFREGLLVEVEAVAVFD